MTNEEIIDHVSTKGNIVFYGAYTAEMYELLNLARQDEREKMGMKQLTGTDLNKLFELYLDKKLKSMLDIDKEVKL